MKKRCLALFFSALLLLTLGGCGKQNLLSPKEPVTLTMWHVYGEQAGSPMDLLVDEFNETIGLEQGIIINVTNLSNSTKIGSELLASQAGKPGALEMPDLFTCHIGNALALGEENLLDWQDYFPEEELSQFVPGFVSDGIADGKLLVFPVSKSTQLIMLNGSQFARFSADTGVTKDDLSTWDGFFSAAEQYYTWSGGTPFCAFDYLMTSVELNAMERSGGELYTDADWYDPNNTAFHDSWMQFAKALVQGHIIVSDLYSNTQVMTGDTLAGLGSSAAILYFNDTVTYADSTSEPINLQTAPFPHAETGTPLMPQAGVGLCAYKTTEKKAEAAFVFVHWLTESQRNLDFVASAGYMPVRNDAFDAIETYNFSKESYRDLYTTMKEMRQMDAPISEPRSNDYFEKVHALYDIIRAEQHTWPQRLANGERIDTLTEETWELLCSLA